MIYGTRPVAGGRVLRVSHTGVFYKHSATQAMLDKCQMVLGSEMAGDRNQLSTIAPCDPEFIKRKGEISASYQSAD